MISPEVTLANALANGADYVAPKSAVSFYRCFWCKNIVAVTACPTGLNIRLCQPKRLKPMRKQGWNVKVGNPWPSWSWQ